MFKLNVGDTPNSVQAPDYDKMAAVTDGFSGSDISVAVRDALMEPLRACQSAKHFSVDAEGFYRPVKRGDPVPPGAKEMSLFDVEGTKLRVPDVSYADFEHVLAHSTSSVSPDELGQFETWTHEFGQEG